MVKTHFYMYSLTFFQTLARVVQVLTIQLLWISRNFAQNTIFQVPVSSYYTFQTIGSDKFPPELESAGKFPSTIFPARLPRQNDFESAPESAQNSIFTNTVVQSNEFRDPLKGHSGAFSSKFVWLNNIYFSTKQYCLKQKKYWKKE